MGYEPDEEIKIVYTSLRPGEKLYKELITEGEGIVPTRHEKIMALRGDGKCYQEMEMPLSEFARRAHTHDAAGIKGVLKMIILEYTPDLKATLIIDSHVVAKEFSN